MAFREFHIWRALGGRRRIFWNCTAGSVLFGISDALAQELEKRQYEKENRSWTRTLEELDRLRLVTATGMGIVLAAFLYPAAYAGLDASILGHHWQAVIKKSVVEVLTVGIVVNSTSMLGRGYLTGRHTPQQCVHHLSQELPMVTLNDARVWIPYNILAFGWIPIHLRPFSTSLMEATWQTYISIRSNAFEE